MPPCKISVVLIALSVALAARGSDDSAREAARQHYARGLERAQQGQYEGALSEFLAAYRDQPHYATLYNIGQAYIELGRSVEAIAALERYLLDGKERVSGDRAAEVRLQIDAQTARTSVLIVSVDAPGASIRVDGLPVGSAPRIGPLRLVAGAHDVSVSAPGRPGMRRAIVLVPAQTLELAFPDAQLPAASEPHPLLRVPEAERIGRPPSPLAAPADRARMNTAQLGYVLGGIGVALGGAAFGHYLWNRERYQRWQTENLALESDATGGRTHRERQIDNNGLAASIERASHWTVASSGAGGAFVASGVTLLLIDALTASPATRESATWFTLQGVW